MGFLWWKLKIFIANFSHVSPNQFWRIFSMLFNGHPPIKWRCKNYVGISVMLKPQFHWTVMAELTRVQAECASVTWRAFSIPGSLVGKQGDLRGEREIGEATHADFFRAVRLFIIIFLVYFVLFSPVSFFFFSKIKSCPSNFIYVFFLRCWISNYYLQSGFKDNRTINEKNTCFSKFIYPKYYYYTIGCNFFPHFSIRIFPYASVIRKYPIRVLQTPVSRGVN